MSVAKNAPMEGVPRAQSEGEGATGPAGAPTGMAVADPAAPSRPPSADSRLRVVTLEEFEAASVVREADRDGFQRRFATLFVDDATVREGGLGRVVYAANAQGESFAVKVLAPLSPPSDGRDAEDRDAWQRAAFDEEYAAHQALSGLRGFPRLYGRCVLDGRPAMVMEWVEGVTLAEAARQLAVDDEGRLSPLTAARLGRDLYELLTRMALTADGFAHRDISPANIMVYTAELTVAQQAEKGTFDLRLIDFGSAAAGRDGRAGSLTAVYGAPRGATADFAAPELLTSDVAAASAHRKDPAVDVYAAAGVLFYLLCGQPPFDLRQWDGEGNLLSPYRVKTETAPRPFGFAHRAEGSTLALVMARETDVAEMAARHLPEASAPSQDAVAQALQTVDALLEPMLSACLQADPQMRPAARDVHEGLAAFCRFYGDNLGAALAGRPVQPCAVPGSAGPLGSAPRQGGGLARRALKIGAAAVWAAVVLSGALLLGGTATNLTFGPFAWSGALPAGACAVLLGLPGTVGCAARGRSGATRPGLARGTAGVLAGLGAVLLLLAFSQAAAAALSVFVPALAAASLAPWALFVADYVFGEGASGPRAPQAGNRALSPSDQEVPV